MGFPDATPPRWLVAGSTVVSATLVVLAALPGVAAGHVKYVTHDRHAGSAARLFAAVLGDPTSVALVVAVALGVVASVAAYLRWRPFGADVDAARRALAGYRDLLPWLVRLSVGLPLVGAGFAGYLFAPVVTPPVDVFGLGLGATALRLFGVTAGFLLLFGLATRLVAAATLLCYLVALAAVHPLVLAFEYVPGLLAVALLGGGRPSADDVIETLAADERTAYAAVDPVYRRLVVPLRNRIQPYAPLVPVVLRLGLGVAFVYLGVTQKLLAPGPAVAVVEKYHLTAVVPVSPALWVFGAGVAESAVGLALALGAFTRASAAVAFLLFTATLFGLPDDPVLAHVSLFGLVSALLVTGAGPYAVDAVLGRGPTADAAAPTADATTEATD
ncbi:MAG: DoxX family protein [Haloferacaceae archaeon]